MEEGRGGGEGVHWKAIGSEATTEGFGVKAVLPGIHRESTAEKSSGLQAPSRAADGPGHILNSQLWFYSWFNS